MIWKFNILENTPMWKKGKNFYYVFLLVLVWNVQKKKEKKERKEKKRKKSLCPNFMVQGVKMAEIFEKKHEKAHFF